MRLGAGKVASMVSRYDQAFPSYGADIRFLLDEENA